jgi:S-adenosylmethionine synthetase
MGDDGQVGRGNRRNGLITPGRPMSIEAVAGKNARHPGRSYQVAAFETAKILVQRYGARSAEVKLVTNIGAPLEEPTASLRLDGNIRRKDAELAVREAIRKSIRS